MGVGAWGHLHPPMLQMGKLRHEPRSRWQSHHPCPAQGREVTRPPCPRRAAALLLSVSHLVLVTRSACRQPAARHWVERSLAAAGGHMAVLRQAAMATETDRPLATEAFRQEQSAI